ncbi:MAG: amidohydrolase [Saprospiraceae bacterium]|nr:amidohydrolase [Saprospiraceae bacterium]
MRIRIFQGMLLAFLLSACQSKDSADTVFINGNFYTVNADQPTAQAIAVQDGRIMKVGSTADIELLKGESTEVIDLEGQFAMPGLIEGHGHFSGLGQSMLNLNFLKVKSWDEIVEMVAEAAKKAKPGEWITGRGWHQEKWLEALDRNVLGYPFHDKLSAVSPDNPVLLGHASGHGLFANAKAMELAGVSKETPNPSGGEIVRDSRGEAIGVFEERAQAIIRAAYQEYVNTLTDDQKKDNWIKGIEAAQKECLENGVTSFQDAGSSYQDIEWYQELAKEGDLNLRLWVMLRHSHDRMKDNMAGFPIINAGDNFFTCKAIKTEVDGALGAFGAWLLKSYNDKSEFHGQNTTPISEVEKIAKLAIDHNMQLCVHAIGDRANRVVLDIMEKNFAENPDKTDLRWRIEHAQHLHPRDIARFSSLDVIASMQGIHCTSDAPFVVKRLGEQRAKEGAYPWRSLLDSGAKVANGTDAPVEDVNPFECLYASVTRKRVDTGLEFFPEQRMTRDEALYSYTLWNAYAGFEEQDKGSLEEGKLADIVVLSKDLTTCTDEEILETEVQMTIVGGEVKYSAD